MVDPIRVLSLNSCYDPWLPTLLRPDDTVIPTTVHGNRLESIIRAQPDVVVHNNFISSVLLRALRRAATDYNFRLVAIQHPQTWLEWQAQRQPIGLALQREASVNRWFLTQQEQLVESGKKLPPTLIILMPNYFMWAADSWTADLLAQVGVELQTPIQAGQLGQVGLAEVIRLRGEHIVFEGFSTHYSRGQDWLHHRALVDWSADKTVYKIKGEVAGCPATQAIQYLEAMQSE
ncbi:MAG TPA: hypothetical protein VFM61_05590 [Pseudidiomarina sp.]|nr:hypothetical protein [Pseudidiomarina sp.]